VGDRWFVDERYVKVNGVWRCVYRAVDQYGQVIDVYVITDRAPALANVIDELFPAAFHNTGQFENNRGNATTAGSRHGCGRCAA
jgi:IS6 family transposase